MYRNWKLPRYDAIVHNRVWNRNVLCDSCGKKFDSMVCEKGQSIGSGLLGIPTFKKKNTGKSWHVWVKESEREGGGEEEERYENVFHSVYFPTAFLEFAVEWWFTILLVYMSP